MPKPQSRSKPKPKPGRKPAPSASARTVSSRSASSPGAPSGSAPQSTPQSTPRAARQSALQSALLEWFARARRPLPWRTDYDPYRVWISEIMLQQTQVETMLPYYRRWMARFPDVAAVAAGPEDDVLKAWEGLGYYARARNLHRAARHMVERHGGAVPGSLEALRALPGIGPYTAGAIASIGFNVSVPAVDGNVARVLARLFALPEAVNTPRGQQRLWRLAAGLLPEGLGRDFNQALMELGALICRPAAPACTDCPAGAHCRAAALGRPERWPRRQPRPEKRLLRGAMLLLECRGALLLRRRPGHGLWGGLWELPWLERRDGETARAAAGRMIRELGLPALSASRHVGAITHGLTHLRLELECLRAQAKQGLIPSPAPDGAIPAADWRWVKQRELTGLALTRLSHKALALPGRGVARNGSRR